MSGGNVTGGWLGISRDWHSIHQSCPQGRRKETPSCCPW